MVVQGEAAVGGVGRQGPGLLVSELAGLVLQPLLRVGDQVVQIRVMGLDDAVQALALLEDHDVPGLVLEAEFDGLVAVDGADPSDDLPVGVAVAGVRVRARFVLPVGLQGASADVDVAQDGVVAGRAEHVVQEILHGVPGETVADGEDADDRAGVSRTGSGRPGRDGIAVRPGLPSGGPFDVGGVAVHHPEQRPVREGRGGNADGRVGGVEGAVGIGGVVDAVGADVGGRDLVPDDSALVGDRLGDDDVRVLQLGIAAVDAARAVQRPGDASDRADRAAFTGGGRFQGQVEGAAVEDVDEGGAGLGGPSQDAANTGIGDVGGIRPAGAEHAVVAVAVRQGRPRPARGGETEDPADIVQGGDIAAVDAAVDFEGGFPLGGQACEDAARRMAGGDDRRLGGTGRDAAVRARGGADDRTADQAADIGGPRDAAFFRRAAAGHGAAVDHGGHAAGVVGPALDGAGDDAIVDAAVVSVEHGGDSADVARVGTDGRVGGEGAVEEEAAADQGADACDAAAGGRQAAGEGATLHGSGVDAADDAARCGAVRRTVHRFLSRGLDRPFDRAVGNLSGREPADESAEVQRRRSHLAGEAAPVHEAVVHQSDQGAAVRRVEGQGLTGLKDDVHEPGALRMGEQGAAGRIVLDGVAAAVVGAREGRGGIPDRPQRVAAHIDVRGLQVGFPDEVVSDGRVIAIGNKGYEIRLGGNLVRVVGGAVTAAEIDGRVRLFRRIRGFRRFSGFVIRFFFRCFLRGLGRDAGTAGEGQENTACDEEGGDRPGGRSGGKAEAQHG